MKIDKRITEVIYTHEQIVEKCQELGKWIDNEYKNTKDLIIVGLLKGSIPFLAELIKHVSVDHIMDFMTVSSFDGKMNSSGNIKIIMDLKTDIFNREVLLVEEIIDSGTTLSKVINHLKERAPKSLKVLTLLNKDFNRKFPLKIAKYGFLAPNHFYAGFGLDVKEKLRNLPYIGIFDKSKFNDL